MVEEDFKELFLNKLIYIDTNIFFDEDLRYLFEDIFDEKIYSIIIPEVQYNEIYKLSSVYFYASYFKLLSIWT